MAAETQTTTRRERPAWLCAGVCAVLAGLVMCVHCHSYQAAQTGETDPVAWLWTLAARGDVDGVRSRLSAGAAGATGSGITAFDTEVALRIAAGYGQHAVIAELLERGVNPDARGRAGVAALMSTTFGQDGPAIARLLIEAGADVDAADDDGRTTLMDAVAERHVELVEALLAAGADVHRADRLNRTALSEAWATGNPQIIRLVTGADAAAGAGG